MSDTYYTDEHGHTRCRNCNGDWTEFAALRARVAAVEALCDEAENDAEEATNDYEGFTPTPILNVRDVRAALAAAPTPPPKED